MSQVSIIILSGPSCVGKTELKEHLCAMHRFAYSVSVTTRKPRPREQHGKDYFFISETEFKQMIQRTELAEHAFVHGCYYGTPKSQLKKALEEGKSLLFDIDFNGHDQLCSSDEKLIQQSIISIFIMPCEDEVKALAILKERMKNRGMPPEEQKIRLENAKLEMKKRHSYDKILVNSEGKLKQTKELLWQQIVQPHILRK